LARIYGCLGGYRLSSLRHSSKQHSWETNMTLRKKLGSGIERLELRAAPSTLLGTGISSAFLDNGLESKFDVPSLGTKQIGSGFVAKVTPGAGSKSGGQSQAEPPAKPQAIFDAVFAARYAARHPSSDITGQRAGARSNIEDTAHSDDHEKGAVFSAAMGRGWVTVNAIPNATGTFSAEIEVKLKGADPNTTYTLQRAPEVGRPLATDGICQRANGSYPWEQPNSVGFPPAPAFPTFVLSETGMPVTVTTNGGGNGKVSFHFDAPGIASGAAFDVEFRAIDLTGVATPIHSDCFQVIPQ
jgi:hypothetical protein